MRALLGLGSNLGDRRGHLVDAVGSLGAVTAVSPVYETDPVGGPGGQPAYLNIVVAIETELSPRELLGVCHRLEAAADRVRAERWGPRTLDVDILWIDGVTVDEPDLVVPHPRMRQRRFVMAPLADIAPDIAPEGWEQAVEGRVWRLGELADLPGGGT
jgi:2-amino-4-hydroxy-6-hydroxymethyldihydropteridine diphosphokinase